MTRRPAALVPLEKSLLGLSARAPLILKLRFPNFRNFEPGAEIEFGFPISILLGRNGSNKSSLLHALYGAPNGYTTAEFWFETHLDAIPETNDAGLKQSVVHVYRDDATNQLVECIKARAPRRRRDPDYWEAVKPTIAYGFPPAASRVPPITLNVVHLDFRGLLPAFDKYFYFPDERHLERRNAYAKRKKTLRRTYRKQDYLRARTRSLRERLTRDGVKLSESELAALSYVLERDYASGTMLNHDLFHGHRGHTLLFHTARVNGGYSEAFAGSGESAAAMLIHAIEGAPDKSLILLDEPETSLHPRAQQRILEFLADRALKKQLQIVIASHSIYLAEGLPQQAIRVLRENSSGKIVIYSSTTVREALHEIMTIPAGKTILVEDERAKTIVLTELKIQSQHALNEFRVLVRPGGTARIYDDIRAFATAQRSDVFVVFDGDHKPQVPIPTSGQLPRGFTELKQLVEQYTKGNNTQGPNLQFVDAPDAIRYLDFLRRNVFFLPDRTPEALVWSEDSAKTIAHPLPTSVIQEQDPKRRLQLLAETVPAYDSDTVFRLLLQRFLEGSSASRTELATILRKIREGG